MSHMQTRSPPQVFTQKRRNGGYFLTETQAEAILAELRPWLRDPHPIDQFREQLDSIVETISAIHRATAHYRAIDEAFREVRRSRHRAKAALRAMEESSTAPEMANFIGLLRHDAMSYAVHEIAWTLSRIPAAFFWPKGQGTKGTKSASLVWRLRAVSCRNCRRYGNRRDTPRLAGQRAARYGLHDIRFRSREVVAARGAIQLPCGLRKAN